MKRTLPILIGLVLTVALSSNALAARYASRILKQGSTGGDVLKLQRFLMDPSIEDSDGTEYKPLNLIILSGTFKTCPAPAKARLRPHEKFTLCAPVLLPKGKTYERVRFQGDVTKDPYFWK